VFFDGVFVGRKGCKESIRFESLQPYSPLNPFFRGFLMGAPFLPLSPFFARFYRRDPFLPFSPFIVRLMALMARRCLENFFAQ
jgi:hypothetical protein